MSKAGTLGPCAVDFCPDDAVRLCAGCEAPVCEDHCVDGLCPECGCPDEGAVDDTPVGEIWPEGETT